MKIQIKKILFEDGKVIVHYLKEVGDNSMGSFVAEFDQNWDAFADDLYGDALYLVEIFEEC
jgi:hypothetical protein